MSAVRILPLEAPYDKAVAATFAKFLPPGMAPLKLFRTQAHNPRVLQRIFAGSLLDKGTISQRAREFIILRTCFRCGCEYEWGVHVALFSKSATLVDADVAATLAVDGSLTLLPVSEACLLRAADELHDTSTISEQLWTVLAGHYSPAQLIEIIALVGNYHAICFVTNAAGVELEAFAPRFPRRDAKACGQSVMVTL